MHHFCSRRCGRGPAGSPLLRNGFKSANMSCESGSAGWLAVVEDGMRHLVIAIGALAVLLLLGLRRACCQRRWPGSRRKAGPVRLSRPAAAARRRRRKAWLASPGRLPQAPRFPPVRAGVGVDRQRAPHMGRGGMESGNGQCQPGLDRAAASCPDSAGSLPGHGMRPAPEPGVCLAGHFAGHSGHGMTGWSP